MPSSPRRTTHHLLLENEHVRVLETLVPAGETTAIHTHRWPNVQYVVSGADFVRRDRDRKATRDTDGADPQTSTHFGQIDPAALPRERR